MTTQITQQDLIEAAMAIGIEVVDKYGTLYSYTKAHGHEPWCPQHNKSQLMDLQIKLKFEIIWFDENRAAVKYFKRYSGIGFDETFESFAAAIILAAAEIGRSKQ